MNRHLVRILGFFAVTLLAGAGVAEAQTVKLGYVNSQRIMAEAPGTAEAQAAFQADMESYRAELGRLEAQLDTLQQNFDRQQATLSGTVRTERQTEIQQAFVAYQQRQMQLEEQAQTRQAELVEPIMQRVTTTIEQLRSEGAYSMIFDTANGALLAGDPAFDLTDQVLTRLRAGQ
jgi:outer membrane protein